ncbi:MAG: NAD-dependent epimerase/dehydratase family protein [Candidatus Comchoanobacterales bacterium]
MTTFLIVGCGYLGRHVCQYLDHPNHQVFYLKRSDPTSKDHGKHIQKDWFKCTTNDIPEVDYVFYTMSPNSMRDADYQRNYTDGTQHLVKLMKQQKALKKIIFVSSTSVYDVHDGRWVYEDDKDFSQTPKAQAILQAESILTQSDLPHIIARLGGIYGHGRHYLMDLIRQGKYYLNHKQVFSNRIHVEDAARCLHHLAQIPESHTIFHGTDPQPTALNTITAWLSSKLGATIEYSMSEDEASRSRLTNKRISSEKLVASGFHFQYPSFREGFIQIMKQERMID